MGSAVNPPTERANSPYIFIGTSLFLTKGDGSQTFTALRWIRKSISQRRQLSYTLRSETLHLFKHFWKHASVQTRFSQNVVKWNTRYIHNIWQWFPIPELWPKQGLQEGLNYIHFPTGHRKGHASFILLQGHLARSESHSCEFTMHTYERVQRERSTTSSPFPNTSEEARGLACKSTGIQLRQTSCLLRHARRRRGTHICFSVTFFLVWLAELKLQASFLWSQNTLTAGCSFSPKKPCRLSSNLGARTAGVWVYAGIPGRGCGCMLGSQGGGLHFCKPLACSDVPKGMHAYFSVNMWLTSKLVKVGPSCNSCQEAHAYFSLCVLSVHPVFT